MTAPTAEAHAPAAARTAATRPVELPAFLGAALFVGLVGAVSPLLGAGLAVLSLVVLAVLLRPAAAAYLLLALTPLIAGIDRGAVVPLVRPNEALALLLGAILFARAGALALRGQRAVPRLTSVDGAFVLLACVASVLPVLWLMARGRELTGDDLQHAVVLWKYLGVYAIVRLAVTTSEQVARCLWVVLASGSVVAVVAILQSLQLFGVPRLLATYYAPLGDAGALANERGTSTLASSIAVGDVMTFCLAIALGWLFLGSKHRLVLAPLSGLFVLGALGSGQFSGVIALVTGVAAVGWLTRSLGRAIAAAVPAAGLGGLLLQPVIERRLAGFDSREGLPHSWVGRLENLQTFFWPELFRDGNYLLGVRPSARVPAPETWRVWVYMESGHTWLLWSGGIPLLITFFVFLWIALRKTARIGRQRRDAIGVAGVASFAALTVVGVLMTLDVHLTLRGAADLLFSLLALSLVRAAVPHGAVEDAATTSGAAGARAAAGGDSSSGRPPARQDVPSALPAAGPAAPAAQRSRPAGRRRARRGLLVAAGVGVLAVLAAGLSVQRAADPEPPRAAGPPFDHVLVIGGSSLAAGAPAVGDQVAWQLGTTGEARVIDGAGYARSSDGGVPLAVAVRELRDLSSVDAIVVQGGEADGAATSQELSTATLHLVDYLQAQAPAASLTLIGAVSGMLPPSPALRRVNGVLGDVAARRGVHYVDPLSASWTSLDPRLPQLLAQAAASARPPAPPGRRALVVSGSSLVASSKDTASRAARLIGAAGTARVVPRAGFSRNAAGGRSLPDELQQLPDIASYDVIVVQGGEADHAARPADVSAAVLQVIDDVQAQAPLTNLVLVGPIPAALPAPGSLTSVGGLLRDAAARRGAAYVDSLALGWTEDDPELAVRLKDEVRRLLSDARA